MPEPSPLTLEETAALREVLATGKQPTVWFTAAAVGVPEGKSGKVTALGDPDEGDFIQVRPTGSQDVLSFGSAEVTVSKPPRRPRKPAASAPEPAPEPATPPTDLGAPAWTADPAPAPRPQPPADEPAAAKRSTTRRPPAARLAKGRKPRPVEMTVTLSANLEGEWTLDVVSGRKRVAKALPLSPAVVVKVAKVLPPDVEDAIDLALDAARDHQRSRVEELEAELAEAKRSLDELFG